MIQNLQIKNVALIEELDIEFTEGLNILSGETGAGKSMIIDSINFVLGTRPSKDFIRAGCEMAEVSIVLSIENENTNQIITEMGIDIDEDNIVIISRQIHENGKSNCRINGKLSTVGILKEISTYLFDMHGQHEHQSLLNQSKHIDLLDKFCEITLLNLKSDLNEYLKTHKEILKNISAIEGDKGDIETKIEMYKFQISEIEAANLKENEEEILYARKKVLNNSEQIAEKTKNILYHLYEGGNEHSAIDKLLMGKNILEQLSSLDDYCTPFANILESIYLQLDDLLHDISKYSDNLNHDPKEILQIENRLDIIYKLKRKYGKDTKEILAFLSRTKEKYNRIANSEEILKKLNKQKEECEEKIINICNSLSGIRKKQAKEIEKQIEITLHDLGMKNAKFKIEITQKLDFNFSGFDKVEFLISPNLGEELKPLSKIASGGEISRVMLALKTVLATADTIETFIFDEIDTGVSGRTAQKVAEKLALLGKTHQLLCITHLPQIASMANSHYLIEKKSENGKTNTHMVKLTDETIITELARLIGGAKITETTLKTAEEMKQMAKSIML